MNILITNRAATELQHKIEVAIDSPELAEDYGYTEEDLRAFQTRIRETLKGKTRAKVEVDGRDLRFIAGEMDNAAFIADSNIGAFSSEIDREYRTDYKVFRALADKAGRMLASVTCHGIEMKCLPVTHAQDHPNWRTRNFFRREVDKTRAKFSGAPDNIYVKDGVLYWKATDRPVPVDVLRNDAKLSPTPAQATAYNACLDRDLAEYRANPPVLTNEDLFEMRAAFGPGVTLVDVLTGTRTTIT